MDIRHFSPRSDTNDLYRIARTKHKDMMRRCYNPKCSAYKYYGGKGVSIAEEWHTLDNFLQDIDKLEGWDLALFLQGKLSLDKDSLSHQRYSVDTCKWVSVRENASMATYLNGVYAVSPEGELHHVPLIVDFQSVSGDRPEVIGGILNRKTRHSKNGWTYHKEKPNSVQRLVLENLETRQKVVDITLPNIVKKCTDPLVTVRKLEALKRGEGSKAIRSKYCLYTETIIV